MSIFTGQKGLRHQFSDLTFTALAGATNAANAKMLLKFRHAGKMAFIDNTLDVPVALLLTHPNADSTDANFRLLWLKVGENRVINYPWLPNLEFDPGTSLWVYTIGAATSGYIGVATWG